MSNRIFLMAISLMCSCWGFAQSRATPATPPNAGSGASTPSAAPPTATVPPGTPAAPQMTTIGPPTPITTKAAGNDVQTTAGPATQTGTQPNSSMPANGQTGAVPNPNGMPCIPVANATSQGGSNLNPAIPAGSNNANSSASMPANPNTGQNANLNTAPTPSPAENPASPNPANPMTGGSTSSETTGNSTQANAGTTSSLAPCPAGTVPAGNTVPQQPPQ